MISAPWVPSGQHSGRTRRARSAWDSQVIVARVTIGDPTITGGRVAVIRTGSAVLRRILGRRLRKLREQAGYTLEAAAPLLEWSTSKLSRIENAQQLVDVHGVKSMLDLYDAGGDRWAELLDLTRAARQNGWWRAYGMGDTSYVGFEAAAVQVQEYAAGFVPGLLQVPGYSRALFEASVVPRSPAEVDREVAIRTIRQRRLTDADDPLGLVAVVDEAVLRNPVGGPAVHAAQLAHLVAAAELPSVTLQVLPAGVGAHAAMGSGFVVLGFGDLGEPDMAYVEHALGAAHVEGEREVATARRKLDQLRRIAPGPAESLVLLRSLVPA